MKKMCKNKQKPESWYEKRELRSRSYTHENQEPRSWRRRRSHVHEKKISGAGAVSFSRRLRSPGYMFYPLRYTTVATCISTIAHTNRACTCLEATKLDCYIIYLLFLLMKAYYQESSNVGLSTMTLEFACQTMTLTFSQDCFVSNQQWSES